MEGKKDFTNNTCVELKVILTVRAGERPGCVLRLEEFCLRPSETKCIDFGNKCNPFLDGIQACSTDYGQLTETRILVIKRGSKVDHLLNNNRHITFLEAGQSLVITGCN